MTARRADLANLPDWPRLMSADQAAAYMGVSAPMFRQHVGVTAVRIGGRVLYDRADLDRWLDDRRTGGHPDDSNEAWLERLDADENPRPQ